MPKLKSNRGAAKRFRRNANGNIKYRKGYRNHILTKKTTKRKRQLRKTGFLARCDLKAVARQLQGS